MKPLLVGECNPYGDDPRLALYPDPPTSAGGRLCHRILKMGEREYLRAFDRVNLCSREWDMMAARLAARVVLEEANAKSRVVVVLGANVAAAFGLRPFEPFESYYFNGARVLVLPHPSGRCRIWNVPGMIERARERVVEVTGVALGGGA